MGWYVASLYLPVEGAIGQEVQQLATRYVVLGIHQVEVLVDGINDDAVWHADLAYLWCTGEASADNLMGTHVDDAVGNGIAHGYLAPLTSVEV